LKRYPEKPRQVRGFFFALKRQLSQSRQLRADLLSALVGELLPVIFAGFLPQGYQVCFSVV